MGGSSRRPPPLLLGESSRCRLSCPRESEVEVHLAESRVLLDLKSKSVRQGSTDTDCDSASTYDVSPLLREQGRGEGPSSATTRTRRDVCHLGTSGKDPSSPLPRWGPLRSTMLRGDAVYESRVSS